MGGRDDLQLFTCASKPLADPLGLRHWGHVATLGQDGEVMKVHVYAPKIILFYITLAVIYIGEGFLHAQHRLVP